MSANHGQPSHVVHIAATANGAQWMHQQLAGLRARGYRTTAIIGGHGGSLEARLAADGIPFHVLDLDVLSSRSGIVAARKFGQLVRLLRRLRPDIVQFHLFPSIILGRLAAWAADVPVRVSMIPGPYYLEAPILSDLDIRTARFDSKVIASCEYTRSLYARSGMPRERVELIYYGQDAIRFDPAHADGARVRRELGIAADRPVVGDVAYFYPPLPDNPFTPRHLVKRGIKGHEVLLRAVPRVLARVPDALFVLIGDGWGPAGAEYVEQLKRLARDLGIAHAVLFAGARADIPDTIAAFDVSVQCSLNENLGGSLESLLMGRPLVASDVGGLPDAVKHEKTGLLVPPGDDISLADAIARLLLDRPLADRLGRAGRQFASERFTLDRTVSELDALYQRELTETRATGRLARRGYQWWRTLCRLAYLGPWCRRELLLPMRAALRPSVMASGPERAQGPSASLAAAPSLGQFERPHTPDLFRPNIIQMAGGTDNADWFLQICRRLRDRGHAVSAIIGWPERSVARQLTELRVPYGATELAFGQGKGRLRLFVYAVRLPVTVLRLARQFRSGRATIVHTHIFNSIIIGRLAAWLARVPCRVSMVPGPLHLEAPFTRMIDRLTWWMDHRVVAGCEATYARYQALGLSNSRLRCIRYGVDAARFDPSLANGDTVRQELNLPLSAPVIGLVAYFYPPRTDWQTPRHMRGRGLKGHEDFLSAAHLVRQRYSNARFLIVGVGLGDAGERYRKQVIEHAATEGLSEAVLFTGHRTDIPDVLASMNVAVQCSLSENYGGTIEALLMARPTVATRVGGMPETVRHEETGLLVPHSDPAALAAAIIRMLDDPEGARRMAAAGRTLMLAHYTIEQTVVDIEAMYADLLNAHREPVMIGETSVSR